AMLIGCSFVSEAGNPCGSHSASKGRQAQGNPERNCPGFLGRNAARRRLTMRRGHAAEGWRRRRGGRSRGGGRPAFRCVGPLPSAYFRSTCPEVTKDRACAIPHGFQIG